MNISILSKAIDHEISTRKSDKFGIKVGGKLYAALIQAGKIQKATFSAWATGLFPEQLPAYDGKYFIFHDWELDDYAFKVGIPDD